MSTHKFVARLALLPALLLPLLAQADPIYYKVTQLGLPAGLGSSAIGGLNNAGVVSGAYFDAGGSKGYLADGAGFSAIGTLAGTQSAAMGINDHGAVVGMSLTAGGRSHAVKAQHSMLADLLPVGAPSTANAINNAGKAVGTTQVAGAPQAAVFSYGRAELLGTLGGASSTAEAINDSGLIAGSAALADGSSHAALFSGGGVLDLGTLGGANSSASDINAHGVVVGHSELADGAGQHAFVYADGQMSILGDLGGSMARGINNAGKIVGEAAGIGGVMFVNGATYALNNIIDPALGLHISAAYDINDSDQIAATACDGSGLCSAVRLDLIAAPVPEPASWGMLGAGLGLLGWAARRRARAGA